MKQVIILTFLFSFFWSCKKKDAEGDLSGKEYIRGRLFLFDQLTQNVFGTPLGEKKVSVSYGNTTDTLNFLFSTTTDKDGYFVFPNLKEKTLYRVYYEEKTNGAIFKAKALSEAPVDSLRLNAYLSTDGQNGFHLTAVDETGAVLNGVSICVFNSPNVLGYTNNACDGSTYKLTTDAMGHAFRFSITSGNYFVNSLLTVNDVPLMTKDTISVPVDRIVFDTVRLKMPNGIKYSVFDSLGGRLSGASICVFTSPAAYRRDTCEGSNFQLTSSINGEASRYNLPSQQYYVYSTYKAGNDIWVARDTVNLSTQIIQDTLILKKKR